MLKCFVLVFNRWRASSTWTRPTSTHIGWRVKETFPETFKSQWDLKNKNVIHRSRSVRIGRNRVPSVWELVLPALHCMTLHCIVLYFFSSWYMLFNGWEVRIGRNRVPSVWVPLSAYGLGRYSKPRAQFLPIRTSQPVNNIYKLEKTTIQYNARSCNAMLANTVMASL